MGVVHHDTGPVPEVYYYCSLCDHILKYPFHLDGEIVCYRCLKQTSQIKLTMWD